MILHPDPLPFFSWSGPSQEEHFLNVISTSGRLPSYLDNGTCTSLSETRSVNYFPSDLWPPHRLFTVTLRYTNTYDNLV